MIPQARVFADLPGASRALASHLEARARDAVARRGRFCLVLSGGSTPLGLYRRLARQRSGFPWRKTHVYFADERAVPATDPSSNFGAIDAALLSCVPLPKGNVHRIEGERRPLDAAARSYERLLRDTVGVGSRPSFDLVLLGLGPDGHTASLFPGQPAVRARSRWVVPVPESGQPPWVSRVSLTVPALTRSREICFLVAGADKARAVSRTFRSRGSDRLPASRLAGAPLTWYLDRSAAVGLPPSVRSPRAD